MSRAVWVNRCFWQGASYRLRRTKEGQAFMQFCRKDFEYYTGFRLKPGEGPVRVKIEVKRVK